MPRRTFSRTFNRDLVRWVAAGAARPAHLCRDEGMRPSTLSQWCTEYAERGDAVFTPRAPSQAQALARRIVALERRCQHLTVENSWRAAAMRLILWCPPGCGCGHRPGGYSYTNVGGVRLCNPKHRSHEQDQAGAKAGVVDKKLSAIEGTSVMLLEKMV
jgi:transposase-like protein